MYDELRKTCGGRLRWSIITPVTLHAMKAPKEQVTIMSVTDTGGIKTVVVARDVNDSTT